jgi:F420-non-reducing hydrogenase iron-sulfur subunit
MFEMTQELVKILGIDSRRLRLEWISGAEGIRFAEVAREFTEQIKNIGPSALRKVA